MLPNRLITPREASARLPVEDLPPLVWCVLVYVEVLLLVAGCPVGVLYVGLG